LALRPQLQCRRAMDDMLFKLRDVLDIAPRFCKENDLCV
jgi:hypothetical protein